MKVCIFMARGLEGCGVTKFSLEQRDWFIKNGHEVTLVYAKDKSFTRNCAHDYKSFSIPVLLAKEYDKTLKLVNDCDILVINSVPATSVEEDTINNYKKIIDNIKPSVRVVVYQHDHSSLSLRRNLGLEETVRRADVIFSHSDNGDFNKVLMKEWYPETVSLFDDIEEAPTVYNFQPPMDIAKVRSTYWKDVSEINMNINRWIGRTTTWKGFYQMFDFHEKHLKPAGLSTIMEGLERSPAFIPIKEKGIPYEYYRLHQVDQIKIAPNLPTQILDRYVNSEMLERMSKSGFGYQLSKLDKKYLQRSLEYTHLELGACGTIPVFWKSTGENLKFRVDNTPLTSHDSGIIWFDENDMESTFERIKELSSDRALYDREREKAYEFLYQHQDSSFCFKEQFDIITK
ncbi:TPA: hypothetical protein ORP60_004601 [Escherichia coli]|nr:hypothetical protein [Escherichia coli]